MEGPGFLGDGEGKQPEKLLIINKTNVVTLVGAWRSSRWEGKEGGTGLG